MKLSICIRAWRERRKLHRERKRERRAEKRAKRRQRSQQLQWKLTRSYTLVTVAAVCSIEILGGLLGWWAAGLSKPTPQKLAVSCRRIAVQLGPLLQAAGTMPPQADLIARREHGAAMWDVLRKIPGNKVAAAVSTPEGEVLASTSETFLRLGDRLDGRLTTTGNELLRAARSGATAGELLARRDTNGDILAVTPVAGPDGKVLGLLLAKSEPPLQAGKFTKDLAGLVILSGIIVGLFAAVVGTGFGFITARRYTRRLQHIADTADRWSQGDFDVLTTDCSQDEIGQLAERLNGMAGKLRELVALRQSLATSEERNSLARDLHDTVKQQLFATTMQIGAARALMTSDPGAAEARLLEAERQAHGAQQELTSILEQLRPGSYRRRDTPSDSLEQALKSSVADWIKQNGIAAQVQCEPLPGLPPATQQALLRILQEALSNIARHSGCSWVQVHVEKISFSNAQVESNLVNAKHMSPSLARLTIIDDGHGLPPGEAGSGMGLRNMRERAEALPGGRFALRSAPGEGTRIEVSFDCSASA